MLRILTLFSLALLVVFAIGCSDDDNPTNSGNQNPITFSDTTWFDASAGVYRTQIDGSSYDQAAYFSFDSAITKAAAWDMSFQRTNINLNGGASADGGGTVVGAYLDGVVYDEVSIDDTAGVNWMEDEVDHIIADDEWYTYHHGTQNPFQTTRNVFTMVDAEGDNYVKFRIDSLVGAGQPPSMGTVWISYFYQSTPNSTDLSGTVLTASITVGSGTGYFDFSAGASVTPASPATSTGWDLMFHSYEIGTNSGPNGPGDCAAFPAWGELADGTDIAGLAAQPAGAPMFPDYLKSAFNGSINDSLAQWYDYQPENNHNIAAWDRVYLVNTGSKVFKLQIESYYAIIQGQRTSGHYTFKWNEL